MLENAHLSSIANLDREHLATELKQVLQDTIFASQLTISPRRMGQVAQEVTGSFLQFLEQEDEPATRAYGQRLAREGLGHRSILVLCETLRRLSQQDSCPGNQLLLVSGRYVFSLLEGYMAGREAYLLQEQERTHQAWIRAQSKQAASG